MLSPKNIKKYYNKNFDVNLLKKLNNEKIYKEIFNSKGSLLLIGFSNNWQYFENKFEDTFVLDLNNIPGPKKFFQQTITKKTPFKNEKFDTIVLSITLEYTLDDISALNEIFRILKRNGKLILQVYYFKDKTNKPLRIYSKLTITDLLRYTKFETKKIFNWGGLEFFFKIRFIKIIILVLKKYFLKQMGTWHWIDKLINDLLKRFKISVPNSGGIIICKKNESLSFKHY